MTRLLVWLVAVGGLVVMASMVALVLSAVVEAITEWWAERRGDTDDGGSRDRDFLDQLRDD